MNHQPFETWIVDRQDLSQEEQLSLQQHLASCAECRNLQEKWRMVHLELSNTPAVAPRLGFTRRYRASLLERRALAQRRQAWKLFLMCSGASAAVLLLLVVYLIGNSTPAEWIQAAMRTITNTADTLTSARNLAVNWFQVTPIGLNLVVWMAITLTLCVLTFIWVFALWRTSSVGALQK
jgi:hypothetical protein